MSPSNSPLNENRMREIVDEACKAALIDATKFVYVETEPWNKAIIYKVLDDIVAATTSDSDTSESTRRPQYKFAVTSTIVQHIASDTDGNKSKAEQAKQKRMPPATSASSTTLGAIETDTKDTNIPAQGDPSNGQSKASQWESEPGNPEAPKDESPVITGSKRGVHCATGGYWNLETDGFWTHKYAAQERLGLDVIVNILWVSV